MKALLISLAAAAITFAAAPAPAQTAPSQVVVSYADLDLSTPAGVRKLDRRLRSAVEIACGPISSADPAGKNRVRDCRAETLAVARAQRDTAIADANAGSQIQLASQH